MKLAQDATVFRLRAQQGDAKAEANLGDMYYRGEGMQDYAEAFRWYRKAADQGDANGQDGLGSMYSHGQGVPQNYAEALRWYHKAADRGDAKGENALGVMYYRGQGVPQDYAEALRWYRRAADQGYTKAQYNLGTMFYYGRGVPQDRAEAEYWYHKAADQGDEDAQRVLGLRGSFGIRSAVSLLAMLAGVFVALKNALPAHWNTRYRQQQPVLTAAGFCGLVYIGLSLFRDFSAFQSMLAVNVFTFFDTFVGGVTVALLVCVFGPKRAKVVLGVSVILLIVNDLIVIASHQFIRSVRTVRGFSLVNGLLLGMAVPLAIFLWLQSVSRAKDKQAESSSG